MTASTTIVRAQRRAELAAFLRSRRALITPEHAGLAGGPRRRTPGLRREEVAQLAGVGVTWYTWLEQGRPINASAQVLDAVAGVLCLDSAEHTHLYRLADMPEAPTSPSSSGALAPDTQAVLDSTALPACVYNGKYDLLGWNDEYAALFPALTEAGANDRNALLSAFTHRSSENPVGSDDCLAQMVATVRAAYARHIGEPDWLEWGERMCAASPAFASLWASNAVSAPVPAERALKCAGHGTFHARTSSFAVTGAPETRMVVFVPVAAADVDLLARLLKRRGESATSEHGAASLTPA